MIRYREYDIDESESWIENATWDKFNSFVERTENPRDTLSRFYTRGSDRLYVIFMAPSNGNRTVGTSNVRPLVDSITRSDIEINELVVILAAPMSQQARVALADLHTVNYQIFLEEDLQYCVAEHVLCAKHQLLSVEEGLAVAAEIRMGLTQQNTYSHDDPVVRFYGWPTERVVRIIRRDDVGDSLAPEMVNYRLILKLTR